MRHYATSRKVPNWNTLETTKLFHFTSNPSSRINIMGSTECLTEICTRNQLGVKSNWCVRLTTSPPTLSLLPIKCTSLGSPRSATLIAFSCDIGRYVYFVLRHSYIGGKFKYINTWLFFRRLLTQGIPNPIRRVDKFQKHKLHD
jgi:hypothetical protein